MSYHLTLYYTLNNPYFQYSNIVWASNYSLRLICLTCYKTAIRIISKDNYYAHTLSRFKQYNKLKFEKINY